jgi:hypothetical protein
MTVGRPSSYTPETATEICAQIAEGKSLRTICAAGGMPGLRTIMQWLADREGFQQQYARAREAQADALAEEILDIADDGKNDTYVTADGTELVNHDHIARSRLRVDSRKWLASKLKPKKYGDKVHQELSGVDGAPLVPVLNVTIRKD